MKKVFGAIALIAFFCGCEKNINFNLKNADAVLVVDASIENGQPPLVILSKSFNFFSNITPGTLDSSFVHNADVTISNGTLTHKLKEYTYPLGAGYFLYTYGIDSSDLPTSFVGDFDRSYTLNIKVGGKEYNAQTIIPALAKRPDSLWTIPAPFSDNPEKVLLMVKSTDPPGLGNYIRYFTKINSAPFLPGENSVFDDQVIDGTTYKLQVDPGIDRNNKISRDSNYFRIGDTITLKLCNIDKATYTFWSTWEFAQQSIGNPFSEPNKVIGNVDNGALGAFYGYAAAYKTIIAQ